MVSPVSDLSLLSMTPLPWKRAGLSLSVWSLMLLTQDIDLTIRLSGGPGRGLKLSALSTAWSMRRGNALKHCLAAC